MGLISEFLVILFENGLPGILDWSGEKVGEKRKRVLEEEGGRRRGEGEQENEGGG